MDVSQGEGTVLKLTPQKRSGAGGRKSEPEWNKKGQLLNESMGDFF